MFQANARKTNQKERQRKRERARSGKRMPCSGMFVYRRVACWMIFDPLPL
jgi:hypothetical protein